jgi:hypothetical protein
MNRWYPWGAYAIVNFKYKAGDVDKVIRMKGYAISKSPRLEGGNIYQVWMLPSLLLGKFDDVESAKAKVEQHLKEFEAK